jgi:DNA-binding NtrC family response regulator
MHLNASGDPVPSVLVIEDEIELREILMECLTLEKLNVLGCSTTDEGRKLLKEQRFDLLVADWKVKNGFVSGLLQEAGLIGKIPAAVMIITGYSSDPEFSHEFFSRYTVLTKPFSLQEFVQTALRLLCRAKS